MPEPESPVLRVLVADDSDVDRALLARIVEREGYAVEQAVDGQDALQRFGARRHDIVLLDALMPGIDGFEVARRIKTRAGADFVPIIFLTSLTEADALARAVDAGGDDFLSKPYNRVILRAKLSALQRMRAMHRTVQSQRDEISRHHAHLMRDQHTAKAVFDKIMHTGELDAPFIRYLLSPLAVFNGDVLLAARNPADELYLLLGDFTGHGLSAAVGAMPLAETFYGMAHKGFTPAEILRHANRKMREILPSGYFCCVMLLSFNFRKHQVEFWNGGLPPGCLFRPGGSELRHLDSSHLPLGILEDERFDARTRILEMAAGDKLILCTDGVIEARDSAGMEFGYARFDRIVQSSTTSAGAFEFIRQAVYDHIGSHGRDDDITLVEITMVDADQLPAARTPCGDAIPGSAEWRLHYELGPRSLRDANPLPLLQQVLMDVPQLRGQIAAVHTVISELYSNALEHGLLGLDSALKSSPDGFVAYYEARARGLAELHSGSISFDIHCSIEGLCGRLAIRVIDSGCGFDYRAAPAHSDPRQRGDFHGRGLRLIQALCTSVRHAGRGNEVEAVFCWNAGVARHA